MIFRRWGKQLAFWHRRFGCIAAKRPQRSRGIDRLVVTVLLLAATTGDAVAQQCLPARQLLGTPSFDEDFGTGSGRSTHPNVLNHTFQPTGSVQDDFYAVGRSADFSNFFMRTDTAGSVDADGTTNGRYLGINMRGKNEPSGGWTGEFFRVNNISLSVAPVVDHVLSGFRFSAAAAGTCDQAFCTDFPNFEIRLFDNTTGTLLGQQSSSVIGVTNDDIWRTTSLDFTNLTGVTSVDLVLFNLQLSGASGNDVGFDNVLFTPIYCPNAPELVLSKSADTSALAAVPAPGQAITYTFSITNSGNVDLDQATTLPVDTMTYGTNGTGAATDTAMTVTRSASSPDNNNGILEVGETIVYTGSFALDQKALDAGGVHNTATTTGDPVQSDGTPRTDLADVQDVSDNDLSGDGTDGGTGGTASDPTVVSVATLPVLTITKTAADATLRAAGDVVTYTYQVTNTGNVTINDVSISDAHNGSGPAPNPEDETLFTDAAPLNDSTDATPDNGVWSSLKPGDSVRFTGQYTVTQTDVDTLQ